jgi:hypothetical protein
MYLKKPKQFKILEQREYNVEPLRTRPYNLARAHIDESLVWILVK